MVIPLVFHLLRQEEGHRSSATSWQHGVTFLHTHFAPFENAFFSHLQLFGPFCHSPCPHSFYHFKALQQALWLLLNSAVPSVILPTMVFFSTQACQTLTSQNFVASKKLHLFPWIYKLLACSHLSSAQAHAGMQITLWIHRPINDLNIKEDWPGSLARHGPSWP